MAATSGIINKMAGAPKQNWSLYRQLTRQSDAEWIRSLTPSQRFDLYADLFDIIWQSRQGSGDWKRLEEWHWKEKVAMRLRMVEAFRKLDEFRERTAL
jgi:hypothetical protein